MSAASGPASELVEVVDEHGRVTGLVTRAEMRAGHLRHRAVGIVVLDSAATRVLVHRRADWKDVWPGRWDIAFGGVCGVGEPALEAARRELAEEAGIEVVLERLGSGRYDDGEVAEVAEVFVGRSDGPFAFADGEVVESDWVSLDRIDEWLEGRPVCPDSVAMALPLLVSRHGRAQ